MNYQEAMVYIQQITRFGINLGLSRMERLLAGLGNPQLNLSVVHVGGTNGKGSVCAMLSSILKAAGFRVGLFTSPHLESYTERFQVNGENISQEEVARIIGMLRPQIEQMVMEGYEHPTEFEVSTALAFQYFKGSGVDLVVLEVGMGGNLDSTNVIDPMVSIITNVSMDHEAILGNTLAEIAHTKAGIIKRGVPLVTAAEGEAWEVIWKEARRLESSVVRVFPSPRIRDEQAAPFRTVRLTALRAKPASSQAEGCKSQQLISIQGLHQEYLELGISLLGEHQGINAATAVAAIEVLQEQGISVSNQDIFRGLADTAWPGRLEIVCQNPLILLDGAHNPAGARRLADFLGRDFSDYSIVLILGILEDKDRSKIIQEIAPLADAIIVTAPPGPRAGDWVEVANQAERFTDKIILQERTLEALLAGIEIVRERQQSGKKALLCVTGSLYLVGEARGLLSSLTEKNRLF